MDETPANPRRWFQFTLGGLMLWVVPYVALLAWITGLRDETVDDDDIFGLGELMFQGLKWFITIVIAVSWPAIFLVVRLGKADATKRLELSTKRLLLVAAWLVVAFVAGKAGLSSNGPLLLVIAYTAAFAALGAVLRKTLIGMSIGLCGSAAIFAVLFLVIVLH